MGKQKIGDFIRKIDYLKAKKDYDDSADNPCNQLIDVERQCNRTLEEFKDGFAAFKEKICIRFFPGRRSPAAGVAYSTICVLTRLARFVNVDSDVASKDLTPQVSEIMMQALVALVKAGPNYTHCEMMSKIMECTPKVQEYAKTLSQKELIPIMTSAKVNFEYKPDEECEESTYASYQHNNLERFFLMFTSEQYKLVQKEFLDTYIHYQAQMPSLSETYAQQVYYTVRGMVGNHEGKNPYLNLKDPVIVKKHISVLQDMVCSEGYTKGKGVDDAAVKTLAFILQATISDGTFEDVFDDLMALLLAIHKNKNAMTQGGNILWKYKVDLFSKINKNKSPVTKIFSSCVSMVVEIFSRGELTSESEPFLIEAIGAVVCKAKTPEEVKQALTVITAIVTSGRKEMVKKGKDALDALKKSKALDWKKHMGEAKEIFSVLGKISSDTMQDNKESSLDKTLSTYEGITKQFLDQLKKGKVLPQLQSNLVACFFDCLVVSTPVKADIAGVLSEKDFMDFTKEEKLRLTVLEKCEKLIQDKDLPWDNRDLAVPFIEILNHVVEAFEENGKNVTMEENKVLMSIFKIVSEGGDSVVEHFYEVEDEEMHNVNMNIWRQALVSYVRLHQESGTMACVAPIMPEILRWAKIALEEDHEEMMGVTFGMINTIGQSAPAEFKESLPKVLDLMLESDKCQEFYHVVITLYPHNSGAVHDRLQDMFDCLEDLNDSQKDIYTTLFYTIAQAHPEAFSKDQIATLFDLCSRCDKGQKNMLLMIIKAIVEKHPNNVAEFFPQLCDDRVFTPDLMHWTSGIIGCIGELNETLAQKAIDYLMKYVDYTDAIISQTVVGTLGSMVRQHQDYMQKYKPKLEKLEETSTISHVRDMAHNMILILEGKSVEDIFENIQQQQEDIVDMGTKIDATIDTVITIGDKVIQHDQEIGELEEGLEKIEERVDDVEEDVGETKIKVEEIDNKTMTNAPKWSRDLTKLMNPTAENDWRLLASRLGYNNDDIRGWATQHDPCMALLSEWYATHKTSEASYAILTALTEMNRMDGVAIVENAMKVAEGVVEDEEFEYPSPPPVFISYQWGFQNEVKLLKQHLNMAGYECWMDVGQMGGGDKLFAKIDNGIRGAKIVICCVTEKYAQSPNCNREVNLSVNLNKPVIPLLMEKMDWPPKGSMGPIFSEYLFIRFFQRGGEETKENDQRYWPIPKFQELLMQLNFFVVPDQKMMQKEYKNWWAPMAAEEIVIDKDRSKKQTAAKKPQQKDTQVMKTDESPLVFLSYQWGKQQQIKALYQRLTSMGYTVWMDIYQMGGGDSLYDKIDKGMRGCKAVVSCVTQKYSLSANCRREVSLADALKKPIIPLLLEQMKWPPDGPMSMLFTELLYINFYRDDNVQMTWRGDTFDELIKKLGQFVPVIETNAGSNDKYSSNATTVNVSVKRQDKENNSEKRTIKTGDRKPSSVTVIPKDKNESEGKPNSSNTTKTDSKTVTDINTSDPKNKSKANVKSNSKENEEQTTVGRETNKRTYIRNASKVDPSDSKKPTTKAFATTVINSKAVKRKGAEDNVSSKAKLSENTTGQGQSTLINKTGNKDSNAKSGQAAVNKT